MNEFLLSIREDALSHKRVHIIEDNMPARDLEL